MIEDQYKLRYEDCVYCENDECGWVDITLTQNDRIIWHRNYGPDDTSLIGTELLDMAEKFCLKLIPTENPLELKVEHA